MAEAERVVTPRKRTLAQAEEGSPSIAGSAQEAVIASLRERLARMEETRNYHGGTDVMGGAIAKQTELMGEIMTQKDSKTTRDAQRGV